MVKTTNKEFRAREMFDRLRGTKSDRLQVVCLVKPHDEDDATIYLALPGREDDWIPMPESLISRFEALSAAAEHKDAHLVRLHFRRPDEQDAEPLHRLLAAQEAASAQATSASAGPGGPQYCYYDALGRYICIPL